MDKIKAIPGQVKDAVVNQVAKAGIKPIQEPQELFQKMFDNIVWVIVLVGVLFLLIMAFLSTQTFFTNNKINQIQKDFPTRNQLQALEFHSASGTEEEIDEIDIKEHKLCDVQICASSKSYLVGRQLLDYGSEDMVVQTLKMGAKFIELDIFENRKYQLVVTNGLRSGNWKLTFNQILLSDIMPRLADFMFNPDVMNNFNDPMILFLNLNIPKTRMEEVAQIITQNFQSQILDQKFSISGDTNILDVPLQELLGKLIIMTSGAIGDTPLDKLVHLRLGDRLKKIYFNELTRFDKKEMIEFNKHHLTLVHPPIGFRSINYNPEEAFDYGCQIVCMFFQRADDFLQEYLSHFANKSFRIKPFEFTRFNDIPQNGYDPDKIAYYNTYMDLDEKHDGVLAARKYLNEDSSSSEINLGCCQVNNDDSMFELDILKKKKRYNDNKIAAAATGAAAADPAAASGGTGGTTAATTAATGATGTATAATTPEEFNIDYQFNTIRLKLQKLNIAEHKDIYDIERIRMDDSIGLQTYIDRHIFLNETKALIENKLDLIYFILTKQLKKALSAERSKIFTTEFEDKCMNLDAVKCNEEPICYFHRDIETSKCGSKMDNIPFPEYCLPKYEVENRNLCQQDDMSQLNQFTTRTGDAAITKAQLAPSKLINNKAIRGLYHQVMTKHNFFGKYSGKKGDFEIPAEQNGQCEFKFITPVDNKEYTMYLTDDTGNNITLDNFNTVSISGKRAKGTFVDRNLREIENRLNLPRLPFHGFADIKLLDFTNDKDEIVPINSDGKIPKCIQVQTPSGGTPTIGADTTDILLGVYKYTTDVTDDDTYQLTGKAGTTFLINSEEIYNSLNKNRDTYHYKMIIPECNVELQKVFDRYPKATLGKAESGTYFSKNDLPAIPQEYLDETLGIEEPEVAAEGDAVAVGS